MPYSFQYIPTGKRKYPMKSNRLLDIRVITVVTGVLLFAVAIIGIGRSKIVDSLLPGDPVITKAALTQLSEDVRQGEPVADALADFCVYIVENA